MNEFGIKRGICVANNGEKGRIKVFVPGVYPEEFANQPDLLPWAEPAMSIFGGNWNATGTLNAETGVCSVPHAGTNGDGAQLWVFFDSNDINHPVYFAAAQSGDGWFTAHENQHGIKTDNVSILIDEKGEIKTTSNTSKGDVLTKSAESKDMPTRARVEIKNEGGCALDLIVTGHVNLKLTGNLYQEITGNVFETLIGDKVVTHKGNLKIEHTGAVIHEVTKNVLNIVGGERTERIGKNDQKLVGKVLRTTAMEGVEDTSLAARTITTMGAHDEYIGAGEQRNVMMGSILAAGGNVNINGNQVNLASLVSASISAPVIALISSTTITVTAPIILNTGGFAIVGTGTLNGLGIVSE